MLGKIMPGRVELTPVMAAPGQFRGSRPLKEEVQLSKGLGSPLTWDIKQTPWRVDGSPGGLGPAP